MRLSFKVWAVIFSYILSRFGYAKVPDAAVQLAMKLRMDLQVLGEDHHIYKSAKALEGLLRSAKYITCRPYGI